MANFEWWCLVVDGWNCASDLTDAIPRRFGMSAGVQPLGERQMRVYP